MVALLQCLRCEQRKQKKGGGNRMTEELCELDTLTASLFPRLPFSFPGSPAGKRGSPDPEQFPSCLP